LVTVKPSASSSTRSMRRDAISAATTERVFREYGEDVKVPYCVVYDISGEQISALRAYFPIAALLQQLTANQGVPA
jgi:hypothetical protein